FVRRVAVTMQHYGIAYERRVLSVFADADAVAELTPLGKVPVLILADGESIFDSAAILDWLDGEAGPDRALTPPAGPARRAVLQHATIAAGLAERSVEYRGETVRRPEGQRDAARIERLAIQLRASLGWLEARAGGDWLCGGAMSQADVTAAVALTNLAHKLPQFLEGGACPRLQALAARCEALPCFRAVPFIEG
ncbi:MAG TPA: glutathione S-transferase family protein, partial [Alphaproteobacteria bacterium]|nr:glutathione S-transferase family protein [Alphaproteobacteria bacterium]